MMPSIWIDPRWRTKLSPVRLREPTRLLQNSENRLPNGRGSQNSRSFDSLSELRALAVVLKLAATRYDYPLDVA